jgi:hypothetical protein
VTNHVGDMTEVIDDAPIQCRHFNRRTVWPDCNFVVTPVCEDTSKDCMEAMIMPIQNG